MTAFYDKRRTTEHQMVLWRWLRDHGESPQIEYFVPVCGGIHVDLAFPERRLAIEVDGPPHNSWNGRDEDEWRDLSLREAGWEVVRIKNAEIDADLESVGHRVLAKLRQRDKAPRSRRSSEPF